MELIQGHRGGLAFGKISGAYWRNRTVYTANACLIYSLPAFPEVPTCRVTQSKGGGGGVQHKSGYTTSKEIYL
jgi:hypothetical protein